MQTQATNGQGAKGPAAKKAMLVSQKPASEERQGSGTASREETIRLKAHSLYEAGGCAGGHELEDWLQAEAQLSDVPSGKTLQAAA